MRFSSINILIRVPGNSALQGAQLRKNSCFPPRRPKKIKFTSASTFNLPYPYATYEQRNFVGYNLWGHKELDTPEHAHTHSLYMTQLKTDNVPTLKNITVS